MPSILEGYCGKSPQPREIAEQEAKEFLQVIEDSASYQFGYNHSIGYCMLGYLCGYYRYYHPIEFLTAFLNNAANEDDIRNGTAYASKQGIHVTMPKWGISRSDYAFDRDRGIIAKGLSSVKYLSPTAAEELYALSQENHYTYFTDLLYDIDDKTSLNTRQLDILIKIDFFSDFGNQRELLYITDMFYNTFRRGQAKKLSKAMVDGTSLEPIVTKYATGVTKSGGIAKSYTVLDVTSILHELEDAVRAAHMSDLEDIRKVRNFVDAMGYVGYISGRTEDRRKLYIMEMHAWKSGRGYTFITKSVGTGKESKFFVYNSVYNKCPVEKGDLIYCESFKQARDGAWSLKAYHLINFHTERNECIGKVL